MKSKTSQVAQTLFQGPQMSKCTVYSDSEPFLQRWAGETESAKWSLVLGGWSTVRGSRSQVWNKLHVVTGFLRLGSQRNTDSGPRPAIGTSWIKIFQFPAACVCLSPKPQPLEVWRREKTRAISSQCRRTAHSSSLPLSWESTARKHVSCSLKCSFTSVSSGFSETQWKSLPAGRVP